MAKRRLKAKHRYEGWRRLEGQRRSIEPTIQLPTDWQPPAAWLEGDTEASDRDCAE